MRSFAQLLRSKGRNKSDKTKTKKTETNVGEPRGPDGPDLLVVRPEIVAPRRDAVRLVHDQASQKVFGGEQGESFAELGGAGELLRGDVEELEDLTLLLEEKKRE